MLLHYLLSNEKRCFKYGVRGSNSILQEFKTDNTDKISSVHFYKNLYLLDFSPTCRFSSTC